MAFSSEEKRLNFGGNRGTKIRLGNMERKMNFPFFFFANRENQFKGKTRTGTAPGRASLIIPVSSI